MTDTYGMGKSTIDYLIDQLRTIGIVDIGIISNYQKSANTATVRLFRSFSGDAQVVRGVEVLWVGNSSNGIWSDCIGSPCLIVYPRSVVASVKERLIDPGKRPYDATGVKCIPLSTRSNANISVGFDAFGDFVIQCENYSVVIDANGITYSNKDSSVVKGIGTQDTDSQYGKIFTVTDDEHTEIYYLDSAGKCAYRFNYTYEGVYSIQRCAYTVWTQEEKEARDDYKNWTWETIWDATGNRTSSLQRQSDDDEKRVIRQEQVQIDGTITRTLNDADGKPITTETQTPDGGSTFQLTNADGKVLLSKALTPDSGMTLQQTNADGDVLNSVTIAADGTLTVAQTKAKNTVTLKQDGTCTINTKGAITVESQDAVTVKGASGVTVDGDGGKISVVNGSYSLADAFNDLITVLDSFATQGSPAAHTAVPGQFTDLKSNLQQFLE